MKKLTTEIFVDRANIIHNKKYDYSSTFFKNTRTKVKIKCLRHGFFNQNPKSHLSGANCPKCINEINSEKRKITPLDFIKKATMVHNNTYDYSKTEYEDNQKKVKIICKKHGMFKQLPFNHLSGHGCKECAILKNSQKLALTTNEFIEKSNKIHKNKYDYSNVKYEHSSKAIEIICKKHGIFKQSANSHLSGNGCSKCSGKYTLTINEFIEKSNSIHKKYDYSNIIEIKNHTIKLPINCVEHGLFYQSIDAHINQKQGCPHCNESKGERIISNLLKENNIIFIRQKSFKDCKNPKTSRLLKFDFFIPIFNLCIEYDGKQHFFPIKRYGGEIGFQKTKFRDAIKDEYCLNNKIKLLRIKFNESIYKKLKKLWDTSESILTNPIPFPLPVVLKTSTLHKIK